MGSEAKHIWVRILTLTYISCVKLKMSHDFLKLTSFSANEENDTYLTQLL